MEILISLLYNVYVTKLKVRMFSRILQDIPPTPWREILTSVPLWGLIFAQIGHDWGFFTLVTDLPKYFKDVMKFNVFEVSKLVRTGNQNPMKTLSCQYIPVIQNIQSLKPVISIAHQCNAMIQVMSSFKKQFAKFSCRIICCVSQTVVFHQLTGLVALFPDSSKTKMKLKKTVSKFCPFSQYHM
jgi:hypothetical protein